MRLRPLLQPWRGLFVEDLFELCTDIREIAREQERWIKIASAFPFSDAVPWARSLKGSHRFSGAQVLRFRCTGSWGNGFTGGSGEPEHPEPKNLRTRTRAPEHPRTREPAPDALRHHEGHLVVPESQRSREIGGRYRNYSRPFPRVNRDPLCDRPDEKPSCRPRTAILAFPVPMPHAGVH